MSELTFTDIFIGDNGYVVLVSAMLLALVGNLFKKYKRFQKRKARATEFNLWTWLKENTDDMLVGFVVNYVLVRLIGTVAEYAFQAAGLSEHTETLTPQDSIFLVSILIGYYTDSIIDKIFK